MEAFDRVRSGLRTSALRFLNPAIPVDQHDDTIVTVGRHTYPRNPRVIHFDSYSSRVTIGSFCSIAHDVVFLVNGEHHMEWVTTFPLRVKMELPGADAEPVPMSRGDIGVGNDVWIGLGATILSGVTIGDGAVVGARAVVSRDVPPYGIVVGNPATLTSKRFDEAVIASLLRIRWWDWSDDVIAERADLICSSDVAGFVEQFDPALRR